MICFVLRLFSLFLFLGFIRRTKKRFVFFLFLLLSSFFLFLAECLLNDASHSEFVGAAFGTINKHVVLVAVDDVRQFVCIVCVCMDGVRYKINQDVVSLVM